ncbi:YqcC family protein [Alteromonas sp. CYL-A6]|uniref:YqcC family protein n=1 Tax=Alteromonas nitratireducens TaxID=3390813 RepID=UPI0034C49803
MPYPSSDHPLLPLLSELESVLRQHQLWEQATPAAWQLDSDVPFAADTLTFPAWLQFIFLPRMRDLLQTGTAVPAMQLVPAAEVFLPRQTPHAAADIISVLSDVDSLAKQDGV